MSGFHIQSDHGIVAHGTDIMRLYDTEGVVLVTAARGKNSWNVKSDKTNDTAPDRASAIQMLTDHALELLGPSSDQGHGYSTLIPHGLPDMP